MKISHEIPKKLFHLNNIINDYPYLLGHLLCEELPYYDKEYAEFYRQEIKKHSYSILDNGAFELSDSINEERLHLLGQEYRPSHLLLPDKLGDSKTTIERVKKYIDKFYHQACYKFVGIVQGKDLEDSYGCAKFLLKQPEIDMIAIPFSIGSGRKELLTKIICSSISNKIPLKKIHFLGCSKPQEIFEMSDAEKSYIYSIDTSAPIICGWKGIEFSSKGYEEPKPKEKLAENLDMDISDSQLRLILHNIHVFRIHVKPLNLIY